MNSSPFYKTGIGCAETDKGCIRKNGNTYKILNNKKGGTWRSGFTSRAKALDQIKGLHANK
jgi:Ser-tRNA(Ala) deacylase AlaX